MSNVKKRNLVLLIFLLGIFMGAIDSGIVSPARTVIKNGFGVTENAGIWMITIYNLAYAVSMPIVSKLSDRYGRKRIYLISILTFGFGSLLCGLSNFYGTFGMFLAARVIQAIGGGGIMPIANAFIGQSFPPEKRGTALGYVGAVYGIATILGPTLGSSILDLAGTSHWGWIFFINVPISILIVALSYAMTEAVGENSSKLDLAGSITLSIVILSIMYALTNLNFFHFSSSIKSITVWPYLIIFVLFLPIFIIVEKKAEDPILNLKYFKDKQIVLTLILGFIVGTGLMGIVFVPQFAENTLKLKSGSGGYLVTLMSLFAGIGAPVGGKLVDKYSAKLVIALGFACTTIGTLYSAIYTVSHPGFVPAIIGLTFIGLGIGFTMGTPLNYLMLSYVDEKESATGLSTLSLIRSIGVTISPNILINFIADAGSKTSGAVRAVMPPLSMPSFPGSQFITKSIGNKFDISTMTFSGGISQGQLDKLKSADVTTIVNIMKDFMNTIFDKIVPQVKAGFMQALKSAPAGVKNNINFDNILKDWKLSYLNSIEAKRTLIEKTFQSTLNEGYRNMFIAAGIIALVGLIVTLMLSNKKSYKGSRE